MKTSLLEVVLFPQCAVVAQTKLRHLFTYILSAPLAIKLWTWFSSVLNLNPHFAFVNDVQKLCNRNWSAQCKLVVKVGLINIISTIW